MGNSQLCKSFCLCTFRERFGSALGKRFIRLRGGGDSDDEINNIDTPQPSAKQQNSKSRGGRKRKLRKIKVTERKKRKNLEHQNKSF